MAEWSRVNKRGELQVQLRRLAQPPGPLQARRGGGAVPAGPVGDVAGLRLHEAAESTGHAEPQATCGRVEASERLRWVKILYRRQ